MTAHIAPLRLDHCEFRYNDIPVPVDEDTYELLRKNGIDPALAQHVAHLFIRDPLVIFDGAVEELDDETQTEHWESIQSTNWYVYCVCMLKTF